MYLRLLFLVFISVLFVSCEADIDLNNISKDVSLHPDLIVPIGGASVSLGQIIANNDTTGKFIIGDDSEINYLSVDKYEFKIQPIDLLKNSKELTKDIKLAPSGAILPPNSILPPLSVTDFVNLGINFNKNADRIDSVHVKSATLSVTITLSPDLVGINPNDMKFTLVFPNGKIRMLDGSSSSQTFTPTAFGLSTNLVISNFNISTSGGESGIPIEIRVDAKTGALPLILTPTSAITCKINFTQQEYSVVYGNFKTSYNLPYLLEQRLDLNKDLTNGLLKFANPQVNITAISNVGAYLNFKIDYIKSYLSTNPNVTAAFANFNGKQSTSIELGRKPKNPGDTIRCILRTFDKDWGRTNLLFENEFKPDRVEYKFTVNVDTLLSSKDETPDFLTSDAKINLVVKTIIPLNFTKGSYYQFKDSISNVFSVISNALNQYPEITYTALVLNISNGLPVKATFTFELVDSLGNLLPTNIEKSYMIAAGKVDANGLVQPGHETKQTLQIEVTKEQLSTLKKAKTIRYTVRIDGENLTSNIHFTKLNTFDIKVGLFVKGDINTTIGTKTQQ